MAHLGSWELDVNNNVLYWSDEVYRIFGLKPREFGATYEAFLEAVHPDDREVVNAAYSGSIQRGKDTYEIEHRVVRKNGDVRIVHEKCEHIRDKSGKIIRSIGMVQDITEQKKIEESLRVARDRYISTIELTGLLGWTSNANGEVVEDIPTWRKLPVKLKKKLKVSGLKRSALAEIARDPALVLKKIFTAGLMFWYVGEDRGKTLAQLMLRLPVLLLAAIGAGYAVRGRNRLVYPGLAVGLVYWLAHLPFAPPARLSAPVLPFLVALAASAWYYRRQTAPATAPLPEMSR